VRNIQTNIKVSKEESEMISQGAALTERSKTGFILWLVKKFMRKHPVNAPGAIHSGGADAT
jgi:hypothetical protein